jgi:hypothetical protein
MQLWNNSKSILSANDLEIAIQVTHSLQLATAGHVRLECILCVGSAR